MSIINFTNENSQKMQKGYNGNNGNKICVKHNNNYYMLKFPYEDENDYNTYNNNIYCEYIGSKIFKTLGIETQEVSIGKINIENKEKRCVACIDFTFNDYDLQEFACIKNKEINSASKGYNSDLNEILKILKRQKEYEQNKYIDFFWKMFIVDAFIGNTDRHNGNWGFLYNKKNDTMKIAPVYDCESSLITTINKNFLNTISKNNYEYLNNFILSSNSAIHINKKCINYKDFITKGENKDCNKALKEITERIDLNEINNIIDNINELNPEIKDLYKTLLLKRKELILEKAYCNINKIIPNKPIENRVVL